LTSPLGFTGNALARWSEKRRDPQWLAAQISHEQARFLPLYKGAPLTIAPASASDSAMMVWLQRGNCADWLASIGEPILLGLMGEIPHFALDVSELGGAQLAGLQSLGTFTPLIAAGFKLAPGDLAIAGQAMGLLNWQRKNRFSPKTGEPMRITEGGFKLVDDVGTEIFPRINPVVMVLVVEGDACLMARNYHFPAGLYSALAGFVEVGESLEECARREVFEETALQIENLQYAGSQPWPLSDSLMVGFTATTQTRTLTLDKDELEDAIWLARGEVKKHLAAGQNSQFFLPPAFSLAGHMIRQWCED
jgi:NAD+ diphosphatase